MHGHLQQTMTMLTDGLVRDIQESAAITDRDRVLQQEHFSYHRGIDIAAPAGTAVSSIHRGTVQSYGYEGTKGNYVKISHGNGVVSVYMHMSRIANIHTGMSVSAGTTIGYVG